MKRLFFPFLLLAAVGEGTWGCGSLSPGEIPGADVVLNLAAAFNLSVGQENNPEIIRMVPGTANRAVAISSQQRALNLLTYDGDSFEVSDTFPFFEDEALGDSETTSMDVDPTGAFAAITKTILVSGDCDGEVFFVDLADGSILNEVAVGNCPDSVAFSPDGRFLAVANESDREKFVNKPADAMGGSVSILDMSGGATGATVLNEIEVATALDSEPETIKIGPDNDTVVFTVEEASQVGIFRISEMSNADFAVDYVALPEGSEPDGVAIDEEGGFAVVGNEKGGSFSVISLPAGEILVTHPIDPDLPSTFCRDLRKGTKQIEPEEVAILRQEGEPFVLFALQESGAVIAYNLAETSSPVFDSAAQAGESAGCENGDEPDSGSETGPEGLTCSVVSNTCFSANEREGTITMYTMTPTVPE